MEETLAMAFEQMRQNQAARIHRITLRIGALSGVVPAAMEFAFDIVARGTPADGATLEMQFVPTRCRCSDCGFAFAPEERFLECPRCGVADPEILQGRELELTAMEVS